MFMRTRTLQTVLENVVVFYFVVVESFVGLSNGVRPNPNEGAIKTVFMTSINSHV